MPDLTADELRAIDIACMHLLEMARRGRKKQQDYLSIDNDPAGADRMSAAVQSADEARVTLRALLAKYKEKREGQRLLAAAPELLAALKLLRDPDGDGEWLCDCDDPHFEGGMCENCVATAAIDKAEGGDK